MYWILFSLLATFLWALGNIIDKYILSKWIEKPIIPVMFVGIIGLLSSVAIYFFQGYETLSNINIAWSFLAGTLYILTNIFYYEAIKLEEASRIMALFQITPLFVSIIAAMFLEEIFVATTYFGIILLVIGAIIISSKNSITLKFEKPFFFMILASFSWASMMVITKSLLNFADFWTIFSYSRIGTIFVLIPIFYFNFSEVLLAIKEKGKKIILIASIPESIGIMAILLITIASVDGYVTIVNALMSLQPLFVLVMAVTLSKFYPKIIKEEIGKSTVLKKIIAIIIMMIGAFLITGY